MLLLVLVGLHAAELPFWKTKDKFVTRVREGEVVVSVASHAADGPGAKRVLTVNGGGRVKAPLAYTYEFARQLDCVARTSGYVTSAELKGDRLKVQFGALGIRAAFEVLVVADEKTNALNFTVIGGPLDGLKSRIEFVKLNDRLTEVGIDGSFSTAHRVKGALVGLGLEGVFKHMAERLRDAVERAYAHPGGQKAKPCGRIAA